MGSVATAIAGDGYWVEPHHPENIKEFDRIVAPETGQTAVRRPDPSELSLSLSVVANAIKCTTASLEVLKRAIHKQKDTLWLFTRSEQVVGCFAMLMLNQAGRKALLENTIDILDPPSNFLVPTGAEPAGIYVWAVVGRSLAADGVARVIVHLQSAPYKFADVYACPATKDGLRFMKKLGFEPVPGHPRNLFQYVRLANRLHQLPGIPMHSNLHDMPLRASDGLDSWRRSPRTSGDGKTIAIRVAASLSDLMQVVAIRGAVYMGEQHCPYDEEFDGNDFCAMHLIGSIGGEPAACMRIRFFADFAKLERLAVRHEFRGTPVVFELARAAKELCRLKGYTRIYGHALERLIPFWKRLGARIMEPRRPVVFSDFSYTEMVIPTERHPNAPSLESDPYVLIRPEGEWDKPGPLELSARRPVTSPIHNKAA